MFPGSLATMADAPQQHADDREDEPDHGQNVEERRVLSDPSEQFRLASQLLVLLVQPIELLLAELLGVLPVLIPRARQADSLVVGGGTLHRHISS